MKKKNYWKYLMALSLGVSLVFGSMNCGDDDDDDDTSDENDDTRPKSTRGGSCIINSDCIDPYLCLNGVCGSSDDDNDDDVTDCNNDFDCQVGKVCVNGVCQDNPKNDDDDDNDNTQGKEGDSCNKDIDCESELWCIDKICSQPPEEPNNEECQSDSDCKSSRYCINGECLTGSEINDNCCQCMEKANNFVFYSPFDLERCIEDISTTSTSYYASAHCALTDGKPCFWFEEGITKEVYEKASCMVMCSCLVDINKDGECTGSCVQEFTDCYDSCIYHDYGSEHKGGFLDMDIKCHEMRD